ncbi:GTP-binding protein [Oceanobacillus neutriphilus]|uniref:Tetracycline resistance ribosomal protection protein Tet(O) n=1 Tax=Oceanobacillus neutriphilus TaxID=531815 RepID=A0ABQ2NPD8_9BACI|nr:GTP-binding protein [Oceanobacillus neutriphilus]GGP07055.1 tetracycline resistance ribosomal protection protein Tet(O) [Oceanobacillus neutriphilus]
MKKIINVGIVAHVDAGKTSLTESIYSLAHPDYQKGSIKKENMLTDALDIEKERGITIKTNSISVDWQGTKINILDMPGHIEFFGEVIRSLSVVDIAILLVSGNDVLQPQTRRIFDVLTEAGIPTVIFVNKVDLLTANSKKIIKEMSEKLSDQLVEMDKMEETETKERIIENSESLLAQYLADQKIKTGKIAETLRYQFLERSKYPVFKGSAINDLGVRELLDFLGETSAVMDETSDVQSATVYKIEFVKGRKQTYLNLLSGELCRGEYVKINAETKLKISNLLCLKDNQFVEAPKVNSGDIFMLPDVEDLEIGDFINTLEEKTIPIQLPTLKTTFHIEEHERFILLNQLSNLCLEDPLLNLQIESTTNEISMMTYGKVQQEFIEDTLRQIYPFKTLSLSLPQVLYKEKVKKMGRARIEIEEPINSYWAEIMLKVEENEGLGVRYKSLVTTGYLKQAFQRAIEQGINQGIKKGLYGRALIDIDITLEDALFYSPVSTPSDFRKLAPYVLYKALLEVGTTIMEPNISFELFIPTIFLGKAVSEIGREDAEIQDIKELKDESVIKGEMNQSNFLKLESHIDELFSGKGYLRYQVSGYRATMEKSVYQQDEVDQMKALLLKEHKKL